MIVIYDIDGRVLHQQSIKSHKSLNLAHLPAGKYIITFIQGNEVLTKRFVKIL